MIKVSIYRPDLKRFSFLTCSGDTHNKCKDCHARFNCYTGELPSVLCSRVKRKCLGCEKSSKCIYINLTVECNLFV